MYRLMSHKQNMSSFMDTSTIYALYVGVLCKLLLIGKRCL